MTFRILPLLLVLMLLVDLLRIQVSVRVCIRVTHPNVEECRSLSLPKTSSMNIQTGIRGFVSNIRWCSQEICPTVPQTKSEGCIACLRLWYGEICEYYLLSPQHILRGDVNSSVSINTSLAACSLSGLMINQHFFALGSNKDDDNNNDNNSNNNNNNNNDKSIEEWKENKGSYPFLVYLLIIK